MTESAHARTGRRPARLATASVFAAATLVGCVASPATQGDHTDQPADRPAARLELSLSPGADVPAGEVSANTVTLTCSPDGGTHPTPQAACNSLRQVGGDFASLPWIPDLNCTDQYDPYTGRATGYWSQHPGDPVHDVDYTKTFGNQCNASVGTDRVFAF